MISIIVMMYMASVLDAPAWIYALLVASAVRRLVEYSVNIYKLGKGE